MIPLHDDNPTRTVSFVTVGLIALNALVFFYELFLGGTRQIEVFFAHSALVPAELVYAPSPAAYRAVFSSMFLHGGWLHLIGNMWFLWIFGNNIEDAVGHVKFIPFYLLCGIAAAAAQVVTQPSSTVPMIGASGAVSGVLGGYLLLYPRARVLTLIPLWIFWRFVYIPSWMFLIFWFALQFFSGWATLSMGAHAGVAFWAHVGGFVAGIALVPLFKKRRVRLFQ